jgi:hypothetical protein
MLGIALNNTIHGGEVRNMHIPIMSWGNVILQVLRHFLVSRAPKVAWLGGSVVLKCDLKRAVRASCWNCETCLKISVDRSQEVLELLGWYKEKRLLIWIKRCAIQVEANKTQRSVTRSKNVKIYEQTREKSLTSPNSGRRAFLDQRNLQRPIWVSTSSRFKGDRILTLCLFLVPTKV